MITVDFLFITRVASQSEDGNQSKESRADMHLTEVTWVLGQAIPEAPTGL